MMPFKVQGIVEFLSLDIRSDIILLHLLMVEASRFQLLVDLVWIKFTYFSNPLFKKFLNRVNKLFRF